ncbi:MAG: hypothetical protein AB3X36_07770 [Leptothrix ochracea]|jgi:hypothetical protein|uniref:hypothetical protein n=1 Tax=Leptothrix ochracea TaxID=735331 RepID=UPI0034E2D051
MWLLSACGGGGSSPAPTAKLPLSELDMLRTQIAQQEQHVRALAVDSPCDSHAECRMVAIDPQTGCATPAALPYSLRSTDILQLGNAAFDLTLLKQRLWIQENPNTVCPAVIYPLPNAICVNTRCVAGP